MLDAAKAMKLSAKDLLDLEIIDEIIKEPNGGAHRDKNFILREVKNSISRNLDFFKSMSAEEIFNNRKNKFLKIGRSKGFMNNLEDLSNLKIKENKLKKIYKSKKFLFLIIGIVLFFSILILNFL